MQGLDDKRMSKRPPKIVRKESDRPVIELGHEFSNPNKFRNYIRTESILKRYNLEWKKNESNRIRVACANDKCGWKCFGSWDGEMIKWVIKSLYNVHSCQTVRVNKQAITEWLAKYYVEEFRDQPN